MKSDVQTNSSDSGYVLKDRGYLYYYKYQNANAKYQNVNADLYKYNLSDGREEFVDSIKNSENSFLGVVRMSIINDRLYYGKGTEDNEISEIYSISTTDNENQPRFEGKINELISSANEEFDTNEFKFFEVDGTVCVLVNKTIYKLSDGNAEFVYRGVCSISVDDDKIYYALSYEKNSRNSSGIMCYDLKDKSNVEILSDEQIKAHNKNTIYGEACYVRNICVSNGDLYFLGTNDNTEILKYSINGNNEIEPVTDKARTRLFRLNSNKLYYVNNHHEMYSINTDGTEQVNLAQGEYVYSYNVYDDKIYYYRVVDDRGYPAGLIEIDLHSGKKRVILIFY